MLKIDLHIHTLVSGDAYNTYQEYINHANELGMDIIGFSEHGYGYDWSSLSDVLLGNFKVIKKQVNSPKLLMGVEANIMNENGDLDVKEESLKKIDYVMAGMHPVNKIYDQSNDYETNTKALLNAIKKGKFKILTHPFFTGRTPFDYEIVFEEACKKNILLEANLNYLKPETLKRFPENLPQLKKMIEIVKKHNKKVIVNSDSHCMYELADTKNLEKVKNEIGLTDDMIINNDKQELLEFLGVEL